MPAKNGSLVASDNLQSTEPLRMGFGREVQGFYLCKLPCTRPRDSKPSRRGFSFASRPAYASYGVKSPAAKKDESAITPLGWLNLIEVSGNLWSGLRGEVAAQGVESIRHANLGHILHPWVSLETGNLCSPFRLTMEKRMEYAISDKVRAWAKT